MTDFFFLGSKITEDGDCSHEIRMIASWQKSYDKPRKHVEKQRHYRNGLTKCLVKAMVFLVVTYGCESWITKKAEH